MSVTKSSLAVLAAATLCACATPAPAPRDQNSSGVCIYVKTRAPVAIFSAKPDRVFFVTQGEIMPSSFVKGGYAYLLNVPPGRYAAVATSRSQSGVPADPPAGGGVTVSVSLGETDYATYFASEIINMTEVTVEPGSIAFMGEFIVDQSLGMEKADDTQLYYYRLLAPGAEQRGGLARIMSGDYHYRGSLHRALQGEDARVRFLKKARGQLAKVGWSHMLR